ncbi:carbohydrate ABC transporter permease [Labrys wisconsinensis]|uniref:Multiple sugar transport system permease protein n=1 Tax=Labrys wisconsinensis TaxID=425677 RepID=A0ABU0J6J8_9HYPH|nr:sugar ABC transporter permease [Labrys wisconsinensis]MDQ0469865.1 multiple sugar transport system permease protein [Labrys wisconsinensis]
MFDNKAFAALLTLPLTLALLALLVYPLVYTITMAFGVAGGVGLQHVQETLATAGFWQVAWNSVVFTASSTLLSFGLGFLMAYAMEHVHAGRRLFVSIFILPLAIMPVVSGLTWSMMLNPALGVVNHLVGLLHVGPLPWATGSRTALMTVVLIDVWQWTPFCFMLIHAGFQSLPREPLEAARVDGAGALQELRHVILPMLRAILVITLIFRFMEAFKAFDVIYVVTQGGPGRASETLVIRAFMQGFRFLKPEVAATIGVLLLLVTMLVTRPAGRFIQRETGA